MKKLSLLWMACAAVACAADIGGVWNFNLVSFGEEIAPAKAELKVDGNKLTGKLNELTIEGTVEGDVVKFAAIRPNGEKFATFEGRLTGDNLTGTAHRDKDDFQWIARRTQKPSAAPQTRTFEP